MREYELYVPLHDNSGQPLDPGKLSELKRRLVERFGGLTHFPQENEGFWKVGSATFRDRIVILRVLTGKPLEAEQFLKRLKKDLRRDWGQNEVLIVARNVSQV
jgi:hypothetical protein